MGAERAAGRDRALVLQAHVRYGVAVPLEYVDDLTPAGWIAERLHPFAQDAGAIIPPGFEAYARIFHPAARWSVSQMERPVTWREIADANLRIYHSEMQFGALVTLVGTSAFAARKPQPGLFDRWPKTGSLPFDLARALVSVLAARTSTPERCWFAAWEGWTFLDRPKVRPTFTLPHRGYYLAKGPLAAALDTEYGVTSAYQSASIWWPDDQAWCVATEVDFDWTYVGGSTECIAAVLANPQLEALPAQLSDGVSWVSDRINPTPR